MQEPHHQDDDEPQSLARMMHLEEAGGRLWEPDELGAILRHQLDAPIEFDLSSLGPSPVRELRAMEAHGGPPVRSFRDLFEHPRPSLALLEWTKQFAKGCRASTDGAVPDEVATVLYFLAIVTAMTRCSRRISRLDDQSLRYGLSWAVAQPWLDESTRRLLNDGLHAVARPGNRPDA